MPAAQHVTSDQEESVQSRHEGTFPILTSESPPGSGFIRLTTTSSPNKPRADTRYPGHNAGVDSAVMNKGSESLELIRKVNLPLPPPTPSISTTAKTTTSQQDDVDLVKSASSEALSNERAGESSLSPTIAPLRITTTASTSTSTAAETSPTTPVMMYPEVFTQLPLDIKTYQVKQMAEDINDLMISTLIFYIFFHLSIFLNILALFRPGPRVLSRCCRCSGRSLAALGSRWPRPPPAPGSRSAGHSRSPRPSRGRRLSPCSLSLCPRPRHSPVRI